VFDGWQHAWPLNPWSQWLVDRPWRQNGRSGDLIATYRAHTDVGYVATHDERGVSRLPLTPHPITARMASVKCRTDLTGGCCDRWVG
jgi:hypothetical protein